MLEWCKVECPGKGREQQGRGRGAGGVTWCCYVSGSLPSRGRLGEKFRRESKRRAANNVNWDEEQEYWRPLDV